MAKLCILSYEFPPETAFGGISAYTEQISSLLVSAGHEVHVFCGSLVETKTTRNANLTVHRIFEPNRAQFGSTLVPFIEAEHQEKPFQLMECPEFGAEGLAFSRLHPEVPLITRLHTPIFLIFALNAGHFRYMDESLKERLRHWFKKLLRIPNPYPPELDPEYQVVARSVLALSPSSSLRRLMIRHWNLKPEQVIQMPYPYNPSSHFLNIPIQKRPVRVISFFGRLELRKGVHLLPPVINSILSAYPDLEFRFHGQPMESPETGLDMLTWLKNQLEPAIISRVQFRHIQYAEIVKAYAETDICIFPSQWENFPLVCLEAMSAGRAVIGSKNGGMADMITHGNNGLLTDPFNYQLMERQLRDLIEHDDRRIAMARAARERILNMYGSDRFNRELIALYERIIKAQ